MSDVFKTSDIFLKNHYETQIIFESRYKIQEKDSSAQMYFERLYKNMPDFGDGIYQLINTYAKLNNFTKAKEMVEVYKKSKSYNKSALDLIILNYPELNN